MTTAPATVAATAPDTAARAMPHAVVARRRRLSRRGRPRVWWAVVAAVVGLAAAGAPLADEDSFGDLVDSLRSVAGGFGAVRWQFLPLLAVIAAVHYGLAAVALRAAAGARMPLAMTTLAQLAASTANRLTPAGLGGAAVNVRYLTRRGTGMSAAISAVAALGVLGAVADLLLLGLLVGAGGWVGLGGAGREMSSLGGRLSRVVAIPTFSVTTYAVILAVVVGIAAPALVGWSRRRRSASRSERGRRSLVTGVVDALRHVADVIRRPRDLVVLMTASAGTTLMMGLAFAFSVSAIPGASPGTHVGLIICAYLLGAAAGNAVPTPAGVGSTEAALVAALVVAHVPASHALQSVLLFRLVTFWAPALAGLPAARALRMRGCL